MQNGVGNWPEKCKKSKIFFVEPSSAELLERYRSGDESAATPLFVRYVERLTAMVRAQMSPSLRRRIDPDDAVQSAYRSFFVRARDGQFTLQRSGELWKLLVTITLNKLRRQIAHHQAQKRGVQRDRAFVDIARHPSPLEAIAAADELTAFMAKLNPLQRQVLQMRLQEERWEVIAHATGRSPRTVRRVLGEIQRIWRETAGADSHVPVMASEAASRIHESPAQEPFDSITPLDYRDFVLERHIGSGAMGKVYRACRKSDGRYFAIKMLRKARWRQPAAIERFMAEAQIIRAMRHTGIVEVHGVGQTPGGGPFIFMEFIDGENLATIAARERPSPWLAVEWIAAAADALHHAHQQGIVHCDLKPSNLLRERTRRIVITDFGLAATRTLAGEYELWGGTPAFMAPEQLDPAFGKISPATDIFALGLVLLHLLTGQTFLAEAPVLNVISSWQDEAISRSRMDACGIPSPLALVLQSCLAIDPSRRIASAELLASKLRQVLAAARH